MIVTDDNRLQNIEERLKGQDTKLDKISQAIGVLAVQDNRLSHVENNIVTLTAAMERLCNQNDGTITRIQNHQASCPRGQISWMWGVIVCLSVLMLGIGVNLLKAT